jgi:hypothetical protein
LVEVKLLEISPTPVPAYQSTTVGLRHLFPKLCGIDLEQLEGAALRQLRGAATAQDADFLFKLRSALRTPDLKKANLAARRRALNLRLGL